jgi:hypothetical protein
MMGTRWSFNFSQFARNNLNRQHHLLPRFMQLTNSTKAGISQNVAVFALAAHGLPAPRWRETRPRPRGLTKPATM